MLAGEGNKTNEMGEKNLLSDPDGSVAWRKR